MRKRKKPQPTASILFDHASILTNVRGLVNPQSIIDAEFARAKRELLAELEKDMTPKERIRLRRELWRLRRRYKKLKSQIANW
jgi:hypothetical protein